MKKLLYTIFLLITISLSLNAQNEINQFNTANTKLVYVPKNLYYLVGHQIASFENAIKFHKSFWDYDPNGRISIFFNDFSDVGNGGTMVIPWNYLNIVVAPFDVTFDVMPSNDRMQWLMDHELTHVVMADKPSSSDRFYRSLFFGKVLPTPDNPLSMVYSYFTTPRWYSPRWYHEGIAVFMETWMSGGLGRTLGAYDEMLFRTMVLDSSYFYKVAGIETEGTTIDFQVGANSYLYGTRFVSYLAKTYGVDKMKQFYNRTDDSRRFYASQFEFVYGISVTEAWNNWIDFEHTFQQANLGRIRKYPITKPEIINSQPLGSVSKPYLDTANHRLIAAVNYPGELAHISSIDLNNGKMVKIGNIYSASLYTVASIAFDESSQTIFVSTHNNDWRGLSSIDLKTGKEKELIEYSRTGGLAFNKADKTLWGIQTNAGRTTIVQIPPPYDHIDNIYTLPYGKCFFDMDISSDGKFLSGTFSEPTGKQTLMIVNLRDLRLGKPDFQKIYEFEDNSASNFVFSKDNRYLFGTSYYSGVSNVYRIEIATKKMDVLTNAESGFFRPTPLSDDSLIVFKYTHEGMQAAKIKIQPVIDINSITYLGQTVIDRNPEVKSWKLPPPSVVDPDSVKTSEGLYHSYKEIRVASLYPVAEGYKDFASFGLRLNLMDDIGINSANATCSYSPNPILPEKERIHAIVDLHYWQWTLSSAWNKTDFYDLFGPTKTSRKGWYASMKYYNQLIFGKTPEKFDWFARLSAYGDLDKLPDYQNINATFDKMYSGTINLHYSFLRKSLGAVEPEQGYEWNLYSYNMLVNKKMIPKVFGNIDFGYLLPLRNSTLFLRNSVGVSLFHDSTNAFSRYYFGGFGNNYVDHLSVQRYREIESFPGKDINELSGYNFAKMLLEWNLPPLRFRNLGFLSFYSTYARLSMFGGGLMTNLYGEHNMTDADRQNIRKTYYSYGTQLDFELVLFSLIKSTFSTGYGVAITQGSKPGGELLVSLKIM